MVLPIPVPAARPATAPPASAGVGALRTATCRPMTFVAGEHSKWYRFLPPTGAYA